MDDISSRSNVQWIDKIAASELTELFNVNASQFLALASKDVFVKVKSHLIPIHIHNALHYLTPDSYFEVTLPVIGLCDFLAKNLKNSIWNEMPQPFATILAINGWGGGAFPRPDFIMVKDILGTQYEILVDAQGQVELPKEGIGLFSMLSEMTLMYTPEQIILGRGLDSLQEEGAQANQLYLLPPPQSHTPFSMTLRTTRLDKSLVRHVDFEQTYVFGVNPDRHQAQLTEFAARTLLRYLVCEADFARRILSSEGSLELGIFQVNRFNDFTLSYEAIGVYYNLLIRAIIHQHLPCEFLLSKAPETAFSMLAFKGIPFDLIDYRVIETTGIEALKEFSNLPPRNPIPLKSFLYPIGKVIRTVRRMPRGR